MTLYERINGRDLVTDHSIESFVQNVVDKMNVLKNYLNMYRATLTPHSKGMPVFGFLVPGLKQNLWAVTAVIVIQHRKNTYCI